MHAQKQAEEQSWPYFSPTSCGFYGGIGKHYAWLLNLADGKLTMTNQCRGAGSMWVREEWLHNPTVMGFPEAVAKSKWLHNPCRLVAHMWAKGLHNPNRLGSPQSGDKNRSG